MCCVANRAPGHRLTVCSRGHQSEAALLPPNKTLLLTLTLVAGVTTSSLPTVMVLAAGVEASAAGVEALGGVDAGGEAAGGCAAGLAAALEEAAAVAGEGEAGAGVAGLGEEAGAGVAGLGELAAALAGSLRGAGEAVPCCCSSSSSSAAGAATGVAFLGLVIAGDVGWGVAGASWSTLTACSGSDAACSACSPAASGSEPVPSDALSASPDPFAPFFFFLFFRFFFCADGGQARKGKQGPRQNPQLPTGCPIAPRFLCVLEASSLCCMLTFPSAAEPLGSASAASSSSFSCSRSSCCSTSAIVMGLLRERRAESSFLSSAGICRA